jgi:REP element-mobilizing transposase RayT
MRSVAQPNHLHCILYLPKDAPELYQVISNAKRFMAYEIVKRLEEKANKELLQKLEDGVRAKEGKSERRPKANYIRFFENLMMQKNYLQRSFYIKN